MNPFMEKCQGNGWYKLTPESQKLHQKIEKLVHRATYRPHFWQEIILMILLIWPCLVMIFDQGLPPQLVFDAFILECAALVAAMVLTWLIYYWFRRWARSKIIEILLLNSQLWEAIKECEPGTANKIRSLELDDTPQIA